MTSQQRYEGKMDSRKMQKIRGRCSAPGCKTVNTVGGKHFFYFPQEPMRCWKWLRFCGLEDRYRVAADATHRLRICMDHFIESDYYSSSQKVILKQTAVPTVHANGLVVPSNPKIRSPPSSPVMPRATLSPGSTPTFRHHKTLRTYARRAKIDSAAAEGTRSLIGLQAATEQAAGLAAMPQTIPAPMSTPASKITASTAYAGMNKDACQQGNSMIGEQLRGYQQPSLLFNVVPTAEAKACRERWTRIRDNHRKALNLRKTRSWQPPKFEKELSFLVPYIFDEESRDSNISSQLSQDNESYLEDAYDEIIDSPINIEDTDDISPLSSTSRSSGRKRKTCEPTAASVLQEYLQKKACEANRAREDSTTDPLTMFFINMAQTVKTFPLPVQINVKSKVFQIIAAEELKIANQMAEEERFMQTVEVGEEALIVDYEEDDGSY